MPGMSRKRAFRIARSRTGLGLFATAPIKKGAFSVDYKGRKLTTEQADKLEAKPLSLRDQQPLDDRRNEPKEPRTLRKSFVSAERRDPQDRAQGHHTGHQEHQNRRRDYLLRP